MEVSMKIKCLGAAQGVTGSCYYIESDHLKGLIDCGSFQGDFDVNQLNKVPFDFNPESLDFVILSHGHIDHSGRLPKLVQKNYHKPIYMTRGTLELTTILLKDSAKIHESDNEKENEKREKAGLDPIEPYYSSEDVINTLPYFYPVDFNKDIYPQEDFKVRFIPAGHMLGSAHIYLEIEGKSFLFSGDIGTRKNPILLPPNPAPNVDYIFMESTYGDRLHDHASKAFGDLRRDILDVTDHKGTVIIPAFSVGRTQEIIYGLKHLPPNPRFEQINLYVDSPMAIEATKVFNKTWPDMKPEVVQALEEKKHPFDMKNLHFIDDATKSYQLNFNKDPKVLISASGMCDAGRILHHLQAYLEKSTTAIFFVGYQSQESLGRKIQNQVKEVKILDAVVENKSQIKVYHGFSGHADQGELLDWLKNMSSPKKIFLVHGEQESIEVLQEKIKTQYGFETHIPSLYEVIEI